MRRLHLLKNTRREKAGKLERKAKERKKLIISKLTIHLLSLILYLSMVKAIVRVKVQNQELIAKTQTQIPKMKLLPRTMTSNSVLPTVEIVML